MSGAEVIGAILAAIPLLRSLQSPLHDFFKARTRADEEYSNYTKEFGKANLRISEAQDEQCILGAARRQVLTRSINDMKLASTRYRVEVAKHCERLRSPGYCKDAASGSVPETFDVPPLDVLATVDGPQDKEKEMSGSGKENAGLAGQTKKKKVLVIMARVKFVVGKSKIKKREKAMQGAVSEVDNFVGAEAAAVIKTKIPLAFFKFVARAKARQKDQIDVPLITIEKGTKYSFKYTLVDTKTVHSKLSEYQIMHGNLTHTSGTTEVLYRDVVVVERSDCDEATYSKHLDLSLKLARLFLEDRTDTFSEGFLSMPQDGDMLRCCLVSTERQRRRIQLIFKPPPGLNPKPRTLRQLLLHETLSQNPTLPPLDARVKFAIRLATSVLGVHSLGLVHKRIHPETILVYDELPHQEDHVFPHRLGYPYLAAFQFSRGSSDDTLWKTLDATYSRHSIYFHPRDQGPERMVAYNMKDDIYSLGICLFEIALWRSLLVWDPDVRDYAPDDAFIPISDGRKEWRRLSAKEKALKKASIVIDAAKERLPPILGQKFTDVVVACMKAGYDDSPFDKEPSLKAEVGDDKPYAVRYLTLVLSNLHAVYSQWQK